MSFDDDTLLRTAQDDPAGFVATLPDPVTLDEVQRAPELFRALKLTVDRDRRPGRFLLTGSADLLPLPRLSESLAGRIEIITLHPLTEAEKNRAPGAFLATLLAGRLKREIKGEAPVASPSLAERLVAGGYPEPLTRSPERARPWHRTYLRTLVDKVGRLRIVSQRQNDRLRSDGNIAAGADRVAAAIEHASVVDDVSLAEVDPAAVVEAAAQLNPGAGSEPSQPDSQVRMAQRARRDAAEPVVVDISQHGAGECA